MKDKYIINDIVLYIPEENRLTPLGRQGKETILNMPVNRCLQLLLQNPGVVIRQETIFGEVWEKHGQYVTMNTLYQNILLLRRGMREAGILISTIKTIPKVGVKFTGKVKFIEGNTNNNGELNISYEGTLASNEGKHDELTTINDELVEGDKVTLENVNRWSLIGCFKERTRLKVLLLTFFFITITSLFFIYPAKKTVFFDTHDKVMILDKCSIYTERENADLTYSKIKNFMGGRKLNCNPGEFLYITKAPKDGNTLVFFCHTTSDRDIDCSTRFKVASKLIPYKETGIAKR